jgi:hypothetical protein
MSRIVLDQETIGKLGGIKEATIICDPQGRAIGILRPTSDKQLQPQISDEEIDRRIKNPGRRYTTEEVLKHLESL